jgi:2-keto-4-pentenoate hydratase/2-oxohepta-3-ene-1,7-dioic acid hydratase in catechol pathway
MQCVSETKMNSLLNHVRFEKRLVTPGKIVCVGRNFVDHISELGNELPDEMVVFTKPNSAISNELCHSKGEQLHYEGELSFLVQGGKFVAVAFGLDLTKRNLQGKLKKKGLPWERAKAFDGSALFSDFVALPPDLETLELALQINGHIAQRGNVKQMIYRPPAILEEIRSFMSLNDGDIVMTGTPKGVGEVQHGDLFRGEVLNQDISLVECSWQAS